MPAAARGPGGQRDSEGAGPRPAAPKRVASRYRHPPRGCRSHARARSSTTWREASTSTSARASAAAPRPVQRAARRTGRVASRAIPAGAASVIEATGRQAAGRRRMPKVKCQVLDLPEVHVFIIQAATAAVPRSEQRSPHEAWSPCSLARVGVRHRMRPARCLQLVSATHRPSARRPPDAGCRGCPLRRPLDAADSVGRGTRACGCGRCRAERPFRGPHSLAAARRRCHCAACTGAGSRR